VSDAHLFFGLLLLTEREKGEAVVLERDSLKMAHSIYPQTPKIELINFSLINSTLVLQRPQLSKHTTQSQQSKQAKDLSPYFVQGLSSFPLYFTPTQNFSEIKGIYPIAKEQTIFDTLQEPSSWPESSMAVHHTVPIEIFGNGVMSSLETITKWLRENEHFSFDQIAAALQRDYKTIWGAYQSAKKKLPHPLHAGIENETKIAIPLSIFLDRSLGVLESLVFYLRSEYQMRYCAIARLVNRDQRTVWVTYDRVKKKVKKVTNTNEAA